jgi:hypothetical protein
MSTTGGPKLEGIGRGGDSNLVLEMDAHDAKSYPGEPTTNLLSTADLTNASWVKENSLTITQVSETFRGLPVYRAYFPSGTLPRFFSNITYSALAYTGNIWYRFHSLPNTADTKPTFYFREYNHGTVYEGVGFSDTFEWTQIKLSHTFSGAGTLMFLIYRTSASTTTDMYMDFCMPQFEQKLYSTPFVREGKGGTGTYNARPASVDLSLNDGSFDDKSPNKLAVTNGFSGVTMPGFGGKFGGNALYFNGNSYLQYAIPSGSSALFGTGNYTIDFWHYMPSGTSLRNYATWFSTYTSGLAKGIIIAQHITSGTYGVWNTSIWLNTGVTILTDQWAHVAIVREGTGGNECTYYLNGTSIMTFINSTDFVTATIKEFTVGALYDYSNAHALQGYMSDVRVCSGTALWTSAFTPPTRRNVSAPLVDLSGSDNGGNFNTKDMTDVATYRDGQVIEPVASAIWDFDNTDDVIMLGPSSEILAPPFNTVSVFAWVKLDSTSGWNGVFGAYSGGSFIHFQLSSGGMNVYLYGPNAAYGTIDSECYISAGEWAHIGFAYGSTVLTVYVNGEAMPTKPTGSTANITSATEVSIGRAFASSRMFNGQIGNVQVYDTTLTDQQAKQNFNSQRSRFKV